MAWYRSGTVSVTNASTSVTGTSTAWIDAAAVGETFLGPDGQAYEITAINSATSLSITPAYKGATAAAQSYAIMPTQGYLRDLAAQAAALVNSYAAVRDGAGAGKFAAGTAAAPSMRATADENTGVNLPGSDVLQLVTGGAERMRIDESGRVGIGEAPAPQYKFQVANGNWCLHSDVGQLFIESSGRVNRWWIAANISDTVDDGVLIGRGSGLGSGTAVLKILNDTTHINPNGGLGYGVGAGGSVVQDTSKTQEVTLNKPCGQITMHNAQLDPNAEAIFFVRNSLVSYYDAVVCNGDAWAFANMYRVEAKPASGGFYVSVTNLAGEPRSDNLRINFAIIKTSLS